MIKNLLKYFIKQENLKKKPQVMFKILFIKIKNKTIKIQLDTKLIRLLKHNL